MTSLRPLLRLAWREIMRHKGRSLLVVALVALMVGAAVGAGTIARTTQASEADILASEFGSADVVVFVERYWAPESYDSVAEPREPEVLELTSEDIERVRLAAEEVLGADAAVARSAWIDRPSWIGDAPFATDFSETLNVADIDLSHPTAADRYFLIEGRYPDSESEVALTHRAIDRLGVAVGDEVDISNGTFTVVGEVARRAWSSSGVAIMTSEAFDEYVAPDFVEAIEVLVSGVDPAVEASFSEWQGRAAVLNRVAEAADLRPEQMYLSTRAEYGDDYFYYGGGYIDPGRPEQLSTLVAALFAVQVALVAAAAFAVGVARRTQQFGQLQAIGADTTHLRRSVLLEAAVTGFLGAVIGTAVGLGVAVLAHSQGWLDTIGDRYPVDFRWNLIDIVGPLLVGVVAALVAAWWPTRRLQNLSAASALADHVPVRVPTTRAPVVGLIVLIAGTLLLIAVTTSNIFFNGGDLGVLLVVVAVLAMFGGALSCIGVLIHRIGERADGFPLLARIVTRNSARHQGRSWVAVAALVAVVILPVLMGASVKAYPDSYASDIGADWLRVEVYTEGDIDGVDAFFEELNSRVAEERNPDSQFLVYTEELRFGESEPAEFRLDQTDLTDRGVLSPGYLEAVSGTPEVLEALGLDPDLWETSDAPEVVVAPGVRTRFSEAEYVLRRGSEEFDFALVDPTPALEYGVWAVMSPETEERLGITTIPRTLAVDLGSAAGDDDRAFFAALGNEVWADTVGQVPANAQYGAFIDAGDDYGGPTAAQAAWIAIGGFTLLGLIISFVTSALSAVEVDKEISTMIAAGAPPSLRRRLLGAQTAYHLFLAAIIGVPLAVLIFWAATRADDYGPSGPTFPWTSMATMTFLVPLVVGVAVALVFRSGRPAVSRRT